VTATSGSNVYVWDQATGVSVEGTTTEPTYTMHSLATATNMWSSQPASLDMTLVYVAVIIVVVVVIVAVVAVFATRRRKK
jgi:heme/copper-type cytochrome/quinol oxidase subunit 2